MSKPTNTPDPERFEQITNAALQVSSAKDVALIQELVAQYLEKGPKVAERELVAHIGEHFMSVYPAVMNDPRATSAIEGLNAAFAANLPAYEAAYVGAKRANNPQEGERPFGEPPFGQDPPPIPWSAVALGGAAVVIGGYYVLEAIAAYCGDVHPPPGESAEVNC
jgi:hypothetical protein